MTSGLKSKGATAKTASGSKKTEDDLSTGMKALAVEPIKVKSKNLDVLAEYRKSKEKRAASFVVIGMACIPVYGHAESSADFFFSSS